MGAVSGRGAAAIGEGDPAGPRLLETYFQALNAGDAAALERFAAEHLSEKERHGATLAQVAQFELGFRRMLGGALSLASLERSTDAELTAVARAEGEFPLYLRLSWKYVPGHPGLIDSRSLGPTQAPESAVTERVPPERLIPEIDAKLTRLSAADRFSGAVLIARDGKPLWQKAYGSADREAGLPNRTETRFRLGSMNKMITSVAIAQLVQAGRLKYTDTLDRVLPDYPNAEIARKVTVHHLLTHTSGLGDIFGPEFDRKKDSLREIRDYLPLFAGQPLRFEPGTRWAYSNAGFIVLGLVVEKLSGQSYYDYVQRHVYDPAGMKDTGSFPRTAKVPNLAVGYTRPAPESPLVPNDATLPWRGMSAGGGHSTAEDLLRFDQALRAHRLLNRELTDTILAGKIQSGPEASTRYAYGFEEVRVGPHRVVGHGGGAPGMNARLDMYLDNGCTVVVLTNQDPPAAERVAAYVRDHLK